MEGVDVETHTFVTSVIDGGELSVVRPTPFQRGNTLRHPLDGVLDPGAVAMRTPSSAMNNATAISSRPDRRVVTTLTELSRLRTSERSCWDLAH
jgi:hypothetical protein